MCKGKNLTRVISLKPTPPANAFLNPKELNKKESFFPLQVNFCSSCGQLQLTHVISPELLFKHYVYVSSTSPVFVAHFEEYAEDLIKRFNLNQKSLVLDIGSNDGILLKPLKKARIKVLGVDPALEIAKKATQEGIETLPYFLDSKIAQKIVKKYGQAQVVTANNVFAHVNDLDELVKTVKIILSDQGVFVIEFPYLVDFFERNYFDLIYHEHLSYLSIRCLLALFSRLDMEIFDVKKVPSHGGSLRVYIQKVGGKHQFSAKVNDFLKQETKLGLNKAETFIKFSKKIENNKQRLTALLKKLKKEGKSIVGFGAPAKGNTLLNHFKINSKILDYIVDDSKYKQGLYTPGTHIPVTPTSKLLEIKPDYILILAWNFAEPIMSRFSEFKNQGGHFIIPVPEPRII